MIQDAITAADVVTAEAATDYGAMAMDMLTTMGPQVLYAAIILMGGFWLAGFLRKSITKWTSKSEKFDDTVGAFLASLVRYAIIGFTIMAVLERFGVETTSLVAVFGAMGLAIGLAMQGTLSNVASGVMLMTFRPFKVRQFVEIGGHAGTICSINLFTTEMDTGDNRRIIIPNSNVWGSSIINVSYHPTRRIQLTFGIDYGDDMDKAIEIIERVTTADKRSMTKPAPVIAVTELADSSVNIMLRVWCKAGDFWGLQWDLTKAMKEAFDKEGVNFPYPCLTVYKDGE